MKFEIPIVKTKEERERFSKMMREYDRRKAKKKKEKRNNKTKK
tara:strand:+ start:66 stop:194 length:129 start_codon:yes stop_codon:yes gene_type:complete